MLNNIFCEMKGKNVIHWGVGLGNGGTVLMCWFLLFIHFSTLKPLSWKVTFSGTQKPSPPQFPTYKYRTGFIVKRKQVRIKTYLGLPINWCFFFILNVAYFAPPKYANLKKIYKIYYYFFFQKEIIGNTYIFIKCINNLKFTISLKF